MSAETEIRVAFRRHFAGESGVWVPRTRMIGGEEVETAQSAVDALESVADYRECLQAYHSMLQGRISVDQYRAELVERYVDMNAQDIDEVRAEIAGVPV